MSKFTAIYMRVSSLQQSTASQEPDLQRWVKAQDENLQVKYYIDKYTGRTMNRPGWTKLWEAIERREVSTLVVYRLDRLGRTASGLTKLFEELQARKINFISLKDAIDLSTSSGRLMANMLASIAAYENEVRGERVRAGQQVARANGKRWGGANKGRRTKITREQVVQVKRLCREGVSKSAISRATGVSRRHVYNLLNNDDG